MLLGAPVAPRWRRYNRSAKAEGRSSVGRASVSKTECRRFESCRPCSLACDAAGRTRRSTCDARRIASLLLQLLPLAIVCALSPWAIVAVILMLASDRPSNSIAWLAGWTVSTFGIGLLMVLFLGGYDFSNTSTPSTAACIVQIVLGVLLLVAASRFWAKRPARTGKLPAEPGWMARIGKMRALWAFLIGAFWINTALVVAAGVDTLRAELSTGQSLTVFAVFTLVTLLVQGALILYACLVPERSAARLGGIREWIASNQQVALAVIALVLAVWLAAQGISGLRG